MHYFNAMTKRIGDNIRYPKQEQNINDLQTEASILPDN